MQIPVRLVQVLKSGEVNLFTDGTKILQLKIENNTIDVNWLKKEFLKDVLRVGNEKSLLERLKLLKNDAEELKKCRRTITISHKGRIVLTLGSGANPTFSQSITRTNAIEINKLGEFLQLII